MTMILIADDNDDIRNLLKTGLERKGFAVIGAKNGTEAIELARSEQPEVIIMDLNMPELDGFDAASQIKHDDELKEIPIIALTAYSLPGDRQRALAAGCDAFQTKPIDMEFLLASIERLTAKIKTKEA